MPIVRIIRAEMGGDPPDYYVTITTDAGIYTAVVDTERKQTILFNKVCKNKDAYDVDIKLFVQENGYEKGLRDGAAVGATSAGTVITHILNTMMGGQMQGMANPFAPYAPAVSAAPVLAIAPAPRRSRQLAIAAPPPPKPAAKRGSRRAAAEPSESESSPPPPKPAAKRGSRAAAKAASAGADEDDNEASSVVVQVNKRKPRGEAAAAAGSEEVFENLDNQNVGTGRRRRKKIIIEEESEEDGPAEPATKSKPKKKN